jgi:hypothetical protein
MIWDENSDTWQEYHATWSQKAQDALFTEE